KPCISCMVHGSSYYIWWVSRAPISRILLSDYNELDVNCERMVLPEPLGPNNVTNSPRRTVVCAFGAEEIVPIELLLDAAVRRRVRHIADVLEGGPHPLRGTAGFVTDVEAHQPEFFLDAGRTGLGRGRAREIDQGVGGVEFVDEVLVLLRIEDSVR